MNKAFLSPSECLYWIHNTLSPMINTHFISGIYLRYNAQNKLLSYSMAGHHAMVLIRGNELIKLGTKGFCLMMFPQLMTDNNEIFLQEKDRLFLFSDGMFEVPNAAEEYLGELAFYDMVQNSLELRGPSFLDSLQDQVLEYSNGAIADDMTMLVIELE